MRRASKSKNLPNFVDYPKLSKHMRDISIGEVNDISDFTKDVHEDEIGAGLYRPLKDYALRLAEYYLRVNKTREDKLREFPNFDKKTSHFHSIIFRLMPERVHVKYHREERFVNKTIIPQVSQMVKKVKYLPLFWFL